VLLVLLPELSARQLFASGSPVAPLLPRAAIGLMNAAVPGPRMPASAYLTLGAGHRVQAGPLADPIRFAWEPLEGDTASAVYARRIGPAPVSIASDPPAGPSALLHPEWGRYLNAARIAGTAHSAPAAGGLGEALRSRGGSTWIGIGAAARTRWGALTAINQAGCVSLAAVLNDVVLTQIRSLLPSAPLTVLDLPRGYPLVRLTPVLLELARDPALDLLLISPYPPPGPSGDWDSLPPLLAIGPGFPPGILTSSTTRTPGLVANIDLAPTLLDRLSIPVPASMTGRRIRSEPPPSTDPVLRLDREATLAQRSVVPLGIGAGVLAVGALLLSVAALSLPGGKAKPTRLASPGPWTGGPLLPRVLSRLAHAGVLTVAAAPLAFLLSPLSGSSTVAGLGAATAAIAAGLALLMHAVPTWRRRPVPWLFLITSLVVALDVLQGCRLVARSPISGYAVAGIRFYGLGNEYMGVLVGTAILAGLALESQLRRFRWLQVGVFTALLLLIGSPLHGADLGGALTAAAGFGAVLILSSRHQRPIRLAGLAVVGLVITGVLFLTWDALRPEASRSHIGDFARSVTTGGWAAAGPLVTGKARMAVRLASTGYALLPLLGVAPLLGLWYHGAGRWLQALLAERPEVRAASMGAIVASLAALLFNDSGIAPWMFITVALLAVLIDEHLRELM
jgi:hypothetical protein